MLELILKITLVYLLVDFVFQTNKMAVDIESKKLKSKYFYLHHLLHLLLILVVTAFDKKYIPAAIVLSIVHLLIDSTTKIFLKDKINVIGSFLLNQVLHSISIAFFVNYFYSYAIHCNQIFNTNNYLLVIAVLSLTAVSSIVIKKTMDYFDYPIPNDGLKNAGKYIGILERLFIFGFIVISFWEGIGFLLAAKSIFRFGDLKENKEIKLTEYILIGTLLSFGIAMLISFIYMYIKNSL